MKAVFADTSFFLASLNPDDELHDQAITLSRQVGVPRVTTGFVLLEVANAMCRSSLFADKAISSSTSALLQSKSNEPEIRIQLLLARQPEHL